MVKVDVEWNQNSVRLWFSGVTVKGWSCSSVNEAAVMPVQVEE